MNNKQTIFEKAIGIKELVRKAKEIKISDRNFVTSGSCGELGKENGKLKPSF